MNNEEERKLNITSVVFGIISSGVTIFLVSKYVLKPVEQLFNYHLSLTAKMISCAINVMFSIGMARINLLSTKE